jgi:hypothetical protein
MTALSQRRLVLVLLDGARADVFRRLLAQGDLPHMARAVVEPGSLRTAASVFPSTTGPAYVPFLSGRFPAAGGVPGIRWLDRAEAGGGVLRQWRAARSYCGVQAGWIDRDLAPGPTLFELVPSVAVCSPIGRGLAPADRMIPFRRAVLGSVAHYLPAFYVALDAAVAAAWRAAARRPWRFLFVAFPGVDGVTHFTDPFHASVAARYRHADRALGAFLEHWRHTVREPPPDVIVTSDHGASRVAAHVDAALALEALGLPTVRHPFHVWRRGARAAVMVSGNGAAHIYLEPRSGRTAPLSADDVPGPLVDALAALPGVELAALRDGRGGVLARTATTATTIAPVDGGINMIHDDGDALATRLPAGRHDDRRLLAHTLDGRLPDAPRQLLQLFDSPRSGDIVLAARAGFDLRGPWEMPEHRAGHGSLHAEHMLVPVASSTPLPPVPLRTVDVMPTILERLGLPLPDGLDGVPATALAHHAHAAGLA